MHQIRRPLFQPREKALLRDGRPCCCHCRPTAAPICATARRGAPLASQPSSSPMAFAECPHCRQVDEYETTLDVGSCTCAIVGTTSPQVASRCTLVEPELSYGVVVRWFGFSEYCLVVRARGCGLESAGVVERVREDRNSSELTIA